MGYNDIEIALRHLLGQLDNWRENGTLSLIEKDIALSRLRKIYTELAGLPLTETAEEGPEPESEPRPDRTEQTPHVIEQDYLAQDDSAIQAEQPTASPAGKTILGIEVSAHTRQEIIDTLFHGNEELFEREINILNGMDSLEAALIYIGETYHWIPENPSTIRFIDLLEQRFQ